MIIPTLNWNPGAGSGDFDTWGGGTIPASDMVNNLVDLMEPFFTGATHFDSFTVYTKDSIPAPSIPRASEVLTNVGTNADTNPTKAVQATWTVKCDDGSLAKIVMLDMQNGGSFERLTFSSLPAPATAFLNEWFSDSNGWASRQNGKPYFFLQIAYTLNEKLRREYHEN